MSALPQSREARELASSKLKEKDGCLCESPARTREIRFCELHHAYHFGKERFDSITTVIKAVMPPSYDTIDPVIVDNARVRGVGIDTYFCDWLRGEDVVTPEEFREMLEPHFRQDRWKTPAQHADKAQKLLEMLLNFWERKNWQAKHVQQIVYDEERKVAGTVDIELPEAIYDLKVVAKLLPTYGLQLGAYADMQGAQEVGIIHVGAERVQFVPYRVTECVNDWDAAWNWFDTRRRLTT